MRLMRRRNPYANETRVLMKEFVNGDVMCPEERGKIVGLDHDPDERIWGKDDEYWYVIEVDDDCLEDDNDDGLRSVPQSHIVML